MACSDLKKTYTHIFNEGGGEQEELYKMDRWMDGFYNTVAGRHARPNHTLKKKKLK